MDKLKDKNLDVLFEAILTLQTVDECYSFFEDLCTVREIQSICQRFTVARMLTEKQVYSDIVAKTGASTATISRVNRSLHYGNDGYKTVFERMEENGTEKST
ncbi:MAG TPA: TrpR-like protein, YerC/YecD [Ruminococcaceae bacterium]|nr:TrpR-like protein, YerC/YecD [Oscillospiraceae bacterium]